MPRLDPCVTTGCHAPCCDAAEVPLLEADVERLRAATGLAPDRFVEPADGWLLLTGTGLGGCVFRAPTELDGHRFMGCTVHDARPAACRQYPFTLRGGTPDQDGPLRVVRDDLCPHRAAFTAAPDVTARLVALEARLQEERQARRGAGDQEGHPHPA